MSLWRVKHTLSPVLERSLIALMLAYGIFAVYLASVRPLVILTTAEINNVQPSMDLDTDLWKRARNDTYRYLYAVPSGWAVDDSDPARVVLASGSGYLISGGGSRIEIEARPLGEREQVVNIAAQELSGTRSALYNVSVHGRPGLFAVTFRNRGILKQIVYVEAGYNVLILRGGNMDPAAFSAFISTIKFLPTNEKTL